MRCSRLYRRPMTGRMHLEILLLLEMARAEMTPRIVGGVSASIKDWPFIAFLAMFGEETAATCGGSLISSQTVLTAAHCLDDITDSKRNFDKFTYSVLMGSTMFSMATMIRNCMDYQTHQSYDPADTQYDIGVLFLIKPVDFSDTVKKVVLMKWLDPREDRDLEVAGWGAWSENFEDMPKSNSPSLKSLKQPLFSTSRCLRLIDEDEDEEPYKGILCAGTINATEFSYSGDSGGPIVKAGRPMQVGLVSFRLLSHGLTVYTSVPYYYRWIEETQNNLYRKHCLSRRRRRKARMVRRKDKRKQITKIVEAANARQNRKNQKDYT